MGSFSVLHWGIVLLVVVLIFGTKKLSNFGSDLGSAIRGLKDGMRGVEDNAAAAQIQSRVRHTVDGRARK